MHFMGLVPSYEEGWLNASKINVWSRFKSKHFHPLLMGQQLLFVRCVYHYHHLFLAFFRGVKFKYLKENINISWFLMLTIWQSCWLNWSNSLKPLSSRSRYPKLETKLIRYVFRIYLATNVQGFNQFDY